jgi:hypothetical protein
VGTAVINFTEEGVIILKWVLVWELYGIAGSVVWYICDDASEGPVAPIIRADTATSALAGYSKLIYVCVYIYIHIYIYIYLRYYTA